MSDLLLKTPLCWPPLKREKTRGLIDEDYEIIAEVYEKPIEWAKVWAEMCDSEVLENGNIRMYSPPDSCFQTRWEIDHKTRKIIGQD